MHLSVREEAQSREEGEGLHAWEKGSVWRVVYPTHSLHKPFAYTQAGCASVTERAQANKDKKQANNLAYGCSEREQAGPTSHTP